MRYPAFLKDGDTIGFTAPSFGCNIEPYRTSFDHAQEIFRKKGYRLCVGKTAYAGDGIGISSAPETCGKEFTDLYCGEDCEVLLSCGGGELMCEILDFVDFEALRRAKPKWFMGYSDNTNLTFLLATLCDTASVYGPCAPAFGMEPWHEAIEDACLVLRGEKRELKGYALYETESEKGPENPLLPYHCTEPRVLSAYVPWRKDTGDRGQETGSENRRPRSEEQKPGRSVRQGESGTDSIQFSGRLIGGCLDILANLCGTKYDHVSEFSERYREDGLIWFLEACDLTVFSIRRAIWELQHAGWFEHVKGFLIGRPLAGRETLMGLDHIHAVTDLLECYQVPILIDVDIGHLPPMMPLITGSMATVSVNLSEGSMILSMDLR